MPAFKLPRSLLLALALLLLGGQQAALAHMVGHLGGMGTAADHVEVHQGDADHGAALTLSHVCTTCIALDNLAVPLPAAVRMSFAADPLGVSPAPTFAARIAAPPRRYAARAPPLSS